MEEERTVCQKVERRDGEAADDDEEGGVVDVDGVSVVGGERGGD